MSRIGEPTWNRVYEKTVETKFAETHWPVYEAEAYRLCGLEGVRYICVRKPEITGDDSDEVRGSDTEPYNRSIKIEKFVDPISPEYAGLFLEFARWFDKQEMEKVGGTSTLDTEHNAQVALTWTRKYGVLGLGTNPNESFAVGGGIFSSSAQIAAERLGVPHLGPPGVRAYKKSPTGGKHETVEMFVLEAYEANVVLKLYEAATPTADLSSIAPFMSRGRDHATYLPEKRRRSVKTEREFWSQDASLAQHWALAVVEQTVTRKLANDVYPILIGEYGSYQAGWGFRSLLGAMWLQMRNFMQGEDNRCLHCGNLFPKRRRDQVYCDETCGGRYRAARSYTRKIQRQERAREATRRRLRS